MLRQSILSIFALVTINSTINATPQNDPFSDYISLEIEKLELEDSLFSNQVSSTEVASIASIQVYDLAEEVTLDFNTSDYLPEGFNAKEGMEELDWNKINLYELEEDLEIGFDTKAHLPKGFNALKGMACEETMMVINH